MDGGTAVTQEIDPKLAPLIAQLGAEFANARLGKRLSQAQLGRKTGLNRGVIYKIEAGGLVLGVNYHVYAQALGMRLALVPDHTQPSNSPSAASSVLLQTQHLPSPTSPSKVETVSPITHVDTNAIGLLLGRVLSVILDAETGNKEPPILDRREFISSLAALLVGASTPELVRRLLSEPQCPFGGPSDVEALAHQCTEYLRLQDSAGTGGSLCDAAIAMDLQVSTWSRSGSTPSKVALELDAFRCELGAWVGWLALDCNRYGVAERYLESTVAQSRVVGRPEIEARALENLSALYEQRGQFPKALRVATAGTKVAQTEGSPKLRALLLLRESHVHAQLGNQTDFDVAVGRARSLLLEHQGAKTTPWLNFLTTGAYDIGLGQLTLGRPDAAVAEFSSIVNSSDKESPRDVVDAKVQVARSQAMLGNLSDAAATALQVLPSVQGCGSERIRLEMRRLRSTFTNQPAPGGSIREFIAAYDGSGLGNSAAYC